MKPNLLTPGENTPRSGVHELVGPRGGKRDGVKYDLTKDKTVPPTPIPDLKFKKVSRKK